MDKYLMDLRRLTPALLRHRSSLISLCPNPPNLHQRNNKMFLCASFPNGSMTIATVIAATFQRHRPQRQLQTLSQYLVELAIRTLVGPADVFCRFTCMVQHLDFTTIRRVHQNFCHNKRSCKHILLTDRLVWQLMLTLEMTKYLSVSQTYDLCPALSKGRARWSGGAQGRQGGGRSGGGGTCVSVHKNVRRSRVECSFRADCQRENLALDSSRRSPLSVRRPP